MSRDDRAHLSAEHQKILEEREKAKRRKRASGRREEPDGGLNINSMMDMMTIILVFLIKSVGEEPIPITQSDDLRLPWSTSDLPPEDMVTLTITKRYVMVLDEGVIPINDDGQIDPSYLQSAESAIIPELQQHIEETLSESEQWANFSGRDHQRVVTIISDTQTPYRLLTQVMITAAAAGVENFKFAIQQRPQGGGGG